MSIDTLFANSCSRIKALRIPSQVSKSQATFAFCCANQGSVLAIQEDGGMVDGIGGTSWDGALVMASVLEDWLLEMQSAYPKNLTPSSSQTSSSEKFPPVPAALKVVELGCGAGLVSILARVLYDGTCAVMTDQETDLAVRNADSVVISDSIHAFSCAHADTGKCDDAQLVESSKGDWDSTLTTLNLPWGPAGFATCDALLHSISSLQSSSSSQSHDAYPDLLLGAEIAVLYKQQPLLCQTIDRLSGPLTLVLLSIDDAPKCPGPEGSSMWVLSSTGPHKTPLARPGAPPLGGYAAMLDRDMAEKGFLKRVVGLQAVQWKKLRDLAAADQSQACDGDAGHDMTRELSSLHAFGSRKVEVGIVQRAVKFSPAGAAAEPPGAGAGASAAAAHPAQAALQPQEVHHICAYFRPPLLALMQEWAAQPGFPNALSDSHFATLPSPLLNSPTLLMQCLLDSPYE